jgi:DNA polymerase/3'-5' exonuclease PolX
MLFTYDNAKSIADQVVMKLQPFCEVILIAGSIRRQFRECKDIEMVLVPKKVTKGSTDLFGNKNTKVVIHPEFVSVIKTLGKVIKGKPDGRMMQIELKEKIMLDMFMPVPFDYWRQFAIRTGSSTYSHKIIARGWLKIGWCGTKDGLRRQSECTELPAGSGKTIWTCNIPNPTLPPVWASEKEFFDWMGVQWLPPNVRYVSE